jgi:RimJ/RimL family protein N-acetyltransferase
MVLEKNRLVTPRLVLREWREEDLEPFSRMNADPRVMEFMLKSLDRSESEGMLDRIRTHFKDHGFGPWVVEEIETARFLGYVGLLVPRFEAAFTPCVEIGWRLAFENWGQGFATEAAKAALAYGFEILNLEAVVAFTTRGNLRSRAVMERLGMTYDPADDFEHPLVPVGHPMRPHVLYRIKRPSRRESP